MPDPKKVIKDLTDIYDEAYDRWVHRPYLEDKLVALIRDGIPDALALLREQEPVKPKLTDFEDSFTGEKFKMYQCGNCGSYLFSDALYCLRCGRKVKWDE